MYQPCSHLPPQEVQDAIAMHAVEGYPQEVCGAWSLQEDGSWKVHRWTNTLPPKQAHHRFVADPLEVLSLLKAEDQGSLSLEGFYHSHPDAPPFLSNEDLRQFLHHQRPLYPKQALLVVGVKPQGRITWGIYRWLPSTPLAHDRKPR